jgi:hypothetical protein
MASDLAGTACGDAHLISRAAGSGVLDQGSLTAKAELSEDIEQGKIVPQRIADTHPQLSGP